MKVPKPLEYRFRALRAGVVAVVLLCVVLSPGLYAAGESEGKGAATGDRAAGAGAAAGAATPGPAASAAPAIPGYCGPGSDESGANDHSDGGSNGAGRGSACDPAELEEASGQHGDGLISFSVVASGAMGDRRDAFAEGAFTDEDWNDLVRRGLVEEGTAPPEFAREQVVVVHAGRRPTAGYEVRVRRVRCGDDAITIVAEVVGPPAGSMAATVVTAPYTIVRLQPGPDSRCTVGDKKNHIVLELIKGD